MALRVIRRFFNRLRLCITGADSDQDFDEYMHQDAYNWKDDQNAKVKLAAYRVLSDSKEDVQASPIVIKEEDEPSKPAHLNDSSQENTDDAESEIDKREYNAEDVISTAESKSIENSASQNKTQLDENENKVDSSESYYEGDYKRNSKDSKKVLTEKELEKFNEAAQILNSVDNCEKESEDHTTEREVTECDSENIEGFEIAIHDPELSQSRSDTSLSENEESSTEMVTDDKSSQFEDGRKCIPYGQESSSYELQQESTEKTMEKQVPSSSESSETEETSIQMTESNHQISPASSEAKVPSSAKDLPMKDGVLKIPKAENLPLPIGINFVDVVIKVGKDHKFPATKKVLCDNSEYFCKRLASNKKRLCVLEVEEKYVNPEAFQSIHRFLCFQQPFTSETLTAEVVRTATYLGMRQILCKIETIVCNTIGTAEYARAKCALIRDIRSKLEDGPTLENPVKKPRVLIKGQKTNLKEKHLKKLSKLKYIRDKEISFFYQSILTKNIDGYIFEQLSTKPHVVVEDKYGLTLKVFNVFKHNFKEAIFVDSEIYIQSMEASLRLCKEFLALSLGKVEALQ